MTQQIADYVACVRSHGARLDADRERKLSASAGTMGVEASAAAEVSDQLRRTYEASDANVLEIIRTCDEMVTGHSGPPGGADVVVDLSGEWDSAFENGGEGGFILTFTRVGETVSFSSKIGHGEGMMLGRVLVGTWSDRDAAGNPVSGHLSLEFSADGSTFTGYWTYEGNERKYWWRGTRRA